jgi:transposase
MLRQKWSRGQVEARLANLAPSLIGMEACVGAHHLSRKLQKLGHDARLMPAKYVRPYSKGQKNDFRDAGVAVRQGLRFLRAELPRILAAPCDALSPRMLRVIEGLAGDWRRLDERIEGLSSEIEALARQDKGCKIRAASGL